jgi:hypothetical protein
MQLYLSCRDMTGLLIFQEQSGVRTTTPVTPLRTGDYIDDKICTHPLPHIV